jgi:hypothetical protein
MTDVILHHYALSPFAEKVRIGLGLKQAAWKSVDIPIIMPKPDLMPLTGGYRKTPVMQVGADILLRHAAHHAGIGKAHAVAAIPAQGPRG